MLKLGSGGREKPSTQKHGQAFAVWPGGSTIPTNPSDFICMSWKEPGCEPCDKATITASSKIRCSMTCTVSVTRRYAYFFRSAPTSSLGHRIIIIGSRQILRSIRHAPSKRQDNLVLGRSMPRRVIPNSAPLSFPLTLSSMERHPTEKGFALRTKFASFATIFFFAEILNPLLP